MGSRRSKPAVRETPVATTLSAWTIDPVLGVTWNAAMDTGGAYLGERVLISLAIMAVRQD